MIMNLQYSNTNRFDEKEDHHMYTECEAETGEGYQELQMQFREMKNIKQRNVNTDINQHNASLRSLKHVLVVLLIIGLICGLALMSALYGLDRSKTKDKQQQLRRSLTKDKLINKPCRSKKTKSTDQETKELGSRGRKFLVSFIQNYKHANETNRTIIVTSETDFKLTVSLSTSQRSNLISISSRRSGSVTLKKIDVHYSLVPSYYTTESKAIIINTSVTSSVLSLSEYRVSSETTTVFPTDRLSTYYIISTTAPPSKYVERGSHFTIASMKDNTLVKIVIRADRAIKIKLLGRKYGKGDTFKISLNRFQTFQIGFNADMTGTTINSSNPVAVFAGNKYDYVGYRGYGSMLMEMVPPAEELDNVFIVPPNIHRYQSNVRILAASKTNVKYITKEIKTKTRVLKNRFVEFIVREDEVAVIYSNEAVLVNSIAASSTNAEIYGDSFMITIPGINQYLDKYTNFVPYGYKFSFATFIIRNDSLRNLQINGKNIDVDSCLFHSSVLVGMDHYNVCTATVSSGVINAETSDGSRFGFIVTGQRRYDGHGYTGNALLTTSCET